MTSKPRAWPLQILLAIEEEAIEPMDSVRMDRAVHSIDGAA